MDSNIAWRAFGKARHGMARVSLDMLNVDENYDTYILLLESESINILWILGDDILWSWVMLYSSKKWNVRIIQQ